MGEISDVKAIVTKNKGTLGLIKEILISRDNTINQKLDLLKNQLDSIKKLHEKLEKDLYQGYGLNWLSPDYFEVHKSTDKDIENWKKGFPFELEAIEEGKEFRRNIVIDNIKSKIESQQQHQLLLLLGESGTSKSTILKEVMCDYFDDGYNILYNYGNTDIKNGDQLVNFIEGILKDGNKVFVAVDNAHDERTSAIFYVIDKISSYDLTKNVRFLLTARLPEFDWFIKDRLSKVLQEEFRNSIRKLTDDSSFRYELPFFTNNEIKEFIEWYSKNIEGKSSAISSEESENIYQYTANGHPIMVKFAVIGKGLEEDVKERYLRYLVTNPMNMQTMLVCSLLDIGNLQITNKLLEDMELLEYVYSLDHATMYQYPDGSWKTIHPRWDLELLSFLYNERDKGIVFKRKEFLEKAVQRIFKIEDGNITASVIGTMYGIASNAIGGVRKMPIDIVESVIEENHIPDYLDDDTKYDLYALYIATAYNSLKGITRLLINATRL